jgi:hypothetical protein
MGGNSESIATLRKKVNPFFFFLFAVVAAVVVVVVVVDVVEVCVVFDVLSTPLIGFGVMTCF